MYLFDSRRVFMQLHVAQHICILAQKCRNDTPVSRRRLSFPNKKKSIAQMLQSLLKRDSSLYSRIVSSRKYDLDRRHPACKNTLQVACRKILKNGSCVRLEITCVKLCLYIYKNSCFVNSTRCTTRHVFRDCVILKDATAFFFLSVERLYQ